MMEKKVQRTRIRTGKANGNRLLTRRLRVFLRAVGISFILGAVFFILPQGPLARAAEKPMDLSMAIIQVAKQTIPAVVHIEVTERQEVMNPLLPFEKDPFFRRFFGNPQMPKKFKRELKGLGSGMIMDAQGHILTNHHVAGGATKIEVFLSDGKHFPAKLVGTDPKTDLAVIRISAPGPLPYVTFGDSDKAEVGEWVVAIGHPRGLDQTVTQGIISAKHRRGIVDPNSYQDFIQTDAAINPGNSGGPLLNLRGEVIGVNAAIASESGGFEGIGFTIPSNMAIHIAKILIAHGKVQRGWIGISIQDLTPELAKSAKAEKAKGVYVADVVKGGPADKGGLKAKDVIVSYGGIEVSDSGVLRNRVADTAVGEQVKVSVLRNGRKEEIAVKVGDLEDSAKMLATVGEHRLGVVVRPLTAQETEEFGLQPNQGVAISRLDFKGPLQAAGFEVGDIILAINDQPVQGVETFAAFVNLLKPQEKIALAALDHKTGQTGMVQVTTR
jgi:serine protease Do